MTIGPYHPDHAAPDNPNVHAAAQAQDAKALLDGPDVVLTSPSTTAKFNIIAVLGAVVPLLLAVASQPDATPGQWAQGIAGALGAGAVYAGAYHRTWWRSPKFYMLGLAAVLTAVAPLITNGVVDGRFALTSQQVSVVVLTAVGAAIAAIVPASQGQDQRPIKAAIRQLYPQD